ncbi:hypothetical protein [Actinacidiphila sp. bgisy144]|uniref:hypothetical protein n=1 Tax=Actinacidiphila sp. bgisy144 TaxID=3413791 RepID=UPI003EBD2A52
MTERHKRSSRDGALASAFGGPIPELATKAMAPAVSTALRRALELRGFLAVVEDQVVRVRERVHRATAADRPLGDLTAADLCIDAVWLESALAARTAYIDALDQLLTAMPSQQPPGIDQLPPPTLTTVRTSPRLVRGGVADPGSR